ncbi:MAG: hypothetical protein ABIH18_00755 [Candidatus Omnitrophota bacterium]
MDKSFIAGCFLAALIPIIQTVIAKTVSQKYLIEKQNSPSR